MLVDTHCHLNFNTFDEDRDLVVQRAVKSGVDRILNPGIDIKTSQQAIELANRFPNVYAAIGIHPNELKSWNESSIEQLRQMANNPKVVAIGEIGLDYYRNKSSKELQTIAFKSQLELAAELDLPIIIHSRNVSQIDQRAMKNLLSILSDWVKSLKSKNLRIQTRPGVLHSFSSDIEYAESAAQLNFLIGITGPVTFKNAVELREVVSIIRLDSLLIETDSPFLTPHPFRGKRNEPANVRFIAEEISNIKKLPFEQVVQKTGKNAKRLFNW